MYMSKITLRRRDPSHIAALLGGDIYRTHKTCYEGLTPQQESDLDGLIIDHVDTLGLVN